MNVIMKNKKEKKNTSHFPRPAEENHNKKHLRLFILFS